MNILHPQGDLSDLGNEIGKIIGVYIDNQEIGYELDDLLAGIEHGISLTDVTLENQSLNIKLLKDVKKCN